MPYKQSCDSDSADSFKMKNEPLPEIFEYIHKLLKKNVEKMTKSPITVMGKYIGNSNLPISGLE